MSVTIDNGLVVIAEGRVVQIGSNGEDAQQVFRLERREKSQGEPPVVLRFDEEKVDDDGLSPRYTLVYDHRQISRETFEKEGEEEFRRRFAGDVPCLCSFRSRYKQGEDGNKRRYSYVVLADIGTADMQDRGEDEKLILTRDGLYDRRHYRVKRSQNGRMDANHPATGIRLCEPRPRPMKG